MEYLAQSLPGLENQSFIVIVLIAAVIALSGVIAFMGRYIIKVFNERLQDSKDVIKEFNTVVQANTTSNNLLAAKIESAKRGSK